MCSSTSDTMTASKHLLENGSAVASAITGSIGAFGGVGKLTSHPTNVRLWNLPKPTDPEPTSRIEQCSPRDLSSLRMGKYRAAQFSIRNNSPRNCWDGDKALG